MNDIVGRDVAGLGGRPLGARQTFCAAFARDLAGGGGFFAAYRRRRQGLFAPHRKGNAVADGEADWPEDSRYGSDS